MNTSGKPIAVGADDAAFEGGRSAPKVERMKEIDDQFHKV
jgi:hypothetical protein